jgi:Kef-type K+ transport system membrane component KefB
MLGIGSVGEFGPIVVVAILLTHKDPVVSSLLLVCFVVIAAPTALLATRVQPPNDEDSKVIESKLTAIGFGFLIPIFFIVSGTHFDLHILLARPSALLRLLLFLVLMLVVRGGPALLLYRRVLPSVQRLPLALFSATGLPLIVVITTIGTTEGRILPENAAALVGAGMVSVLLFPATGLRMLRNTASSSTEADPKERAAEVERRPPQQDSGTNTATDV